MKVKMSITISEGLLEQIDAKTEGTRSSFIEEAVVLYLQQLSAQERDRRDIELINKFADELNREAEAALSDQVEI